MDRNKIIEKMFEKLEKNVMGLGIKGYHNIELGKYGKNNDLIFVGVDVKSDYDEDDDVYITDIKLLSVQNSKNTVYIEDIKI